MSIVKEQMAQGHSDLYHIGGKGVSPNLYIGQQVKVTWLKPWGNHAIGFSATGILKDTFAVGGRTLIGEIWIEGPHGKKVLTAPWSRRYLDVQLV